MLVFAAMTDKTLNVLVLCTGNSARSILGEVLFNTLGEGRAKAYSAGSQPSGTVNPGALAKLEREGLPTNGLESKSWDRFAEQGAPEMDVVITVCDNAAGETCPVWFGTPVRAHWGIPDPAAADDETAAFDLAFAQLKRRVEQTLELPLEEFDARARLDALERIHDAAIVAERAPG